MQQPDSHDNGHQHDHAAAVVDQEHGHDHATGLTDQQSDHGNAHAHSDEGHAGPAHDSGHGHAHDGGGGGHGHAHGGPDAAILGSREAMRTLGISLVVLGVTAAIQVVIFVLSGSVALLADTIHNFGDALTALPLAAAFLLGRRPATRLLTYGYGKAEDFAGIAVILIILVSAAVAAYEAIDRLIHPHAPTHLLAIAIAGVVGFVGNELVAVHRIRSGRRIGSAALEADGYHARIDGFTSLAVVAGAIGVALGFRQADPIVGLLISIAILRIVWQSAREIGLRAMDGIEPHVLEQIEQTARQVDGVQTVSEVRARWLGHVIRAELAVSIDPDRPLREATAISDEVEHRLTDQVQHLTQATVRPTATDSPH